MQEKKPITWINYGSFKTTKNKFWQNSYEPNFFVDSKLELETNVMEESKKPLVRLDLTINR